MGIITLFARVLVVVNYVFFVVVIISLLFSLVKVQMLK